MTRRSRWLWALCLGAAASLFLAHESVSVQPVAAEAITEAALRDLPRTLPTVSAGLSDSRTQTTLERFDRVGPPPTLRPKRQSRAISVAGTATWYCLHGTSPCTLGYRRGLYAAISPDLRYLGNRISVCRGSRCVNVTVIDCNCEATHSIDLYSDAFRRIGYLWEGRLDVTISKRPAP